MNAPSELPASFAVPESPRKLRIALVFYRWPFPMVRGDQLTISHFIGFLAARGHDVDLYTLDIDRLETVEQREWLEERCDRLVVHDHPWSRRFVGVLRALLRGWPLQVGYFYSHALQQELNVLAGRSQPYDVAYVHTVRVAPLLPESPSPAARILAMQLSLELNARRIAERSSNPLRQLLYRWEARRLARFESRIWQRFDRTLLIGERDLEMIRSACSRQSQPVIDNWALIPHGTDVRKFSPAEPTESVPNRVVFSGNMNYEPNVQAIVWFVEKCWPRVRSAVPDAQLVIAGKDPARRVRQLGLRDGVLVTGTVPDLSAYIRSAAVCVNPMQAAGGMQNKLIEYFACGKPVVATTIANEGIGAPASVCSIADEPAEFAAEVVRMLDRSDVAADRGRAARAFVEREWTWERHFLDLEALMIGEVDGR